MAINWKLRESVFRLLAAVYAELGEAAVSVPVDHEACPLAELINAQFKGRYASIAKFYGNDATYDAVKSFFAKEISRASEDLQRQNPGHQRTGRPPAQRTSAPRSSRRTMHLDFNEQDISFVSEREVEVHSRHALQKPPKRPRLVEDAQPYVEEEEAAAAPEVQLADSHVAPEFTSTVEIANGIHSKFRAVNERHISLHPQTNVNGVHHSNVRNPPLQREFPTPTASRELTSNSTDPSYVPSPSPTFAPPSRTRAAPKKRPFKEVQEFDLEHHTISSSSSQPTSDLTREPESFGYVSNAGMFRCALCFSQLPTQEALDKHEARSQLHLKNLQNPAIVSKGRAKLAQVTALPYQPSDTPTISRPLKLGGFGERSGPHHMNDDTPSSGPSYASGFTDQYQPPRRQENLPNSSRTMDTIEVLPRRTMSPPPSQIHSTTESNDTVPDSEHCSEMEMETGMDKPIDKGKRRASPYPTSAAQSHRTAPANLTSQATRRVNEDDEASAPKPAQTAPNDIAHNTTDAKPQTTKPPSRLRPLEVAEILRLTGIRLAQEYIAAHPDLIAQTMGRVQREFTAASASANGSVGSVSVEPAGRGAVGDLGPDIWKRRDGGKARGKAKDVDVVVID